MDRFVPYEKLSKKAQRDRNKQRRRSWGGISPITRKSESKKLYNRKKTARYENEGFQSNGLFVCRKSALSTFIFFTRMVKL